MNQVELLRHVASNLESGRASGSGLQCEGDYSRAIVMTDMNLCDPESYTLAPRTHEVNVFTVPAPLTEPPAKGTYYYVASTEQDYFFLSSSWDGIPLEYKYLRRGLIHLTEEAAQQNALAMIGRDPALGVEDV